MKMLNLNFATLIVRFYLMMAIIIGAFFINMPWLSFLALPVFFATLMGIEFRKKGIKAHRKAPASPSAPMTTRTSFE